MGNKLKLEDIVILNEGQQAKLLIEAKYGTLKNFYQQVNPSISLKSIMNYCCTDKIHSETFKCLVVNKSDKGWNDIVKSKQEQITRYVNEIYNNTMAYKEEEDLELFNKLVELCSKYKLVNEKALMYRNIAKNYFYRNDNQKMIEYYNKAIDFIRYRDNNILTMLTIELANHYFKEQNVDESEILFKRAQEYIENNHASNEVLYKYYYYRGVICNTEGRHAEAREYLEKSIQYGDTQTESMSDKGAAYISIGSTYKREGEYEKAKEYYYRALMHMHEKDIYGRTMALNNVADIYCILKDYDRAIKFIEQAKSLLGEGKLLPQYVLIYQTYAEIKLMIGDTSGCYEFFDFLEKTVNTSINIKKIVNRIIGFINYLEDTDLLYNMYDVICHIKDNTDNYIYKHDLFSCMGRISEKIRKKEVYNVQA